MFVQQLVIYALVGVIMDYAGYSWDTSMYWCMLTLVIVSNYLARKEGFESGLDAANDVLELSNSILEQAREHVDKHTKDIEAERKALQDTLNKTKDTL
jgi:hypothetical protein